DEINLFLKNLQARSRRKPAPARQLKPVEPHDLHRRQPGADSDPFLAPLQVLEEEVIPFTLWWGEPGAEDADAIRVAVHPEVNADYAAVSFYMDIGRRSGTPLAATGEKSTGGRRGRLLAAVD